MLLARAIAAPFSWLRASYRQRENLQAPFDPIAASADTKMSCLQVIVKSARDLAAQHVVEACGALWRARVGWVGVLAGSRGG